MNLKFATAIVALTALAGCSTPTKTKAALPVPIEQQEPVAEVIEGEVDVTETEGKPRRIYGSMQERSGGTVDHLQAVGGLGHFATGP